MKADVFMVRDRVPIHQNLSLPDERTAVNVTRGRLELAVCHACGFVFNRGFDLARLSYGPDYDNNQACSPSFNEYLDGLARYLVFEKNVRNCRVVEVGCGRGGFLKKLIDIEGGNNIGFGFDPSYLGPPSDLDGRLRFEQRYYGPDCADVTADIVICRHVIEHVPNPLELIEAVGQALKNTPGARVFFETPCVEWILRNQIIWDFFYEHCSYFTAESLRTAFTSCGFEVDSVHHVFGGQYLWLEATLDEKSATPAMRPGDVPRLAYEFAEAESALKRIWKSKIDTFAETGRVALWGAGAKGVTFANLIDPERETIACVVDLNPNKQGMYIPGTGHPIVSVRELADYDVRHAILMNPNYRDENLILIRQAGLSVDLVGSMEQEFERE